MSRETHRGRSWLIALVTAGVVAALAVDFALTDRGSAETDSRLRVVAAESSWGSIAAQLGGDRVDVTSIVDNPAVDPHDYEPTAADARAVATARLLVVNGAGYDPWAAKLASANPLGSRLELTVGDLVGVNAGGNPHLWYSPNDVHAVIRRIVAAYVRLDPGGAGYYRRRGTLFVSQRLASYTRLANHIARLHRGAPVGASESIFAPLATSLGLHLVTPSGFLSAVSEGAEPTAADTATAERQIDRREIAVWVVNSQNSTPEVARLTTAARDHGIPVISITETPTPAGVTFQSWQARQLQALASALRGAR
jgi:zinc/manganese transport system substrate-binding protein